MSRPLFHDESHFAGGADASCSYRLLPFRFARIPDVPKQVLITSDTGDYLFLSEHDFRDFISHSLQPGSYIFRDLKARHFLSEADEDLMLEAMAAQLRTKKSFLRNGPALHIFVPTLRCDHSCLYCQVSRQNADSYQFDMTDSDLVSAIDRLFESPSPELTVEFQGGEPLLAPGIVKRAIEQIAERNAEEKRQIRYVVATTLHHVTDDLLSFFNSHGVHVSTSLDGPEWLHNANRPNRKGDSFQRTIEGVIRAREALGDDKVAALPTISRLALDHPEAIVDAYVESGFSSIFLRPISPFGFAVRSKRKTGYPIESFIEFYGRAFGHLVDLNLQGIIIDEAYAAILLTHILTPFPTGYVDLCSPCGAGTGVLVYNYDGSVYSCDEGRMLAEMGDDRFRLGHVSQPYIELFQSEAMRWLMSACVCEALPGCSDCAFVPYCGACPVHHLATQGDPIGHRPTSDFCKKHTALFQLLFRTLGKRDPEVMKVLLAWITHRSPASIPHIGYLE